MNRKSSIDTKVKDTARLSDSLVKNQNCKRRNRKSPFNSRAFTTDFVRDELAKENCELISEYVNCNEQIEYIFENVKYKVRFRNWRNDGYRPHIYLKQHCPTLYEKYVNENSFI